MSSESAPATASRWRRLRRRVVSLLPILGGALVLFGVIALILYFVYPVLPDHYREIIDGLSAGEWEESRDRIAEALGGAGWRAEGGFLLLQVLQVVLAPIPGQVLGLLGGYLFGFGRGLLLTMLGLTVGSVLAMGLGRVLGDGVLRRLVPKGIMQRFDTLIHEGGVWNFFLLFLLPGLPDDAICLMAGLTRLPLGRLIAACVIGRLPSMAALVFVGAQVGDATALGVWVGAAALLLGALLWLFSDELEEWFLRRQRLLPKQ